VWTQQQLQSAYGIQPDGTNFYYGLVSANATTLAQTGSPFNAGHQAFFAALLESLRASSEDEKTLVLGLEPTQGPQPYTYVADNLDLVRAVASGLATLQQTALEAGKRLQIVIRYGSEMNDAGQPQGGNPDGFTTTFAQVKGIFTLLAPGVLMSFSPAIREDLPVPDKTYWPGDANVDVIGGTWYIGNTTQQASAIAKMQAYFLQWLTSGKPFALSEVGGCQSHDGTTGIGNDAMLQVMLQQLEALQLRGVEFKYVTIFLASVWGSDATLKFLG
jgi:hypothetical protein